MEIKYFEDTDTAFFEFGGGTPAETRELSEDIYGSSLFPVGRGGLDGWRMMAIDATGTDLWTVAWAWEELEGSGVAV
jgi:hypothetical protein